MRTISATVNSREEAEAARRRLQGLGIGDDRILFKEVGEPGGGIFVTVKAAPEQVEAATDILKGGGAEARPMAPEPVQPRAEAAAPTPPPMPAADRRVRVLEADPPAQPRSVEHSTHIAETRTMPARARQPGSVRLARMAAIAALLAGLGFAIGAALGILA